MFKAFGKQFCRRNSPSWFGTLSPCDQTVRRWQQAWMVIFHMFFMVVGVGGLIFGRVNRMESDTVFEFLFFSAVFNIYIISLAYLYSPSMRVYVEGDYMVSMTRLDDDDDEIELDGVSIGGNDLLQLTLGVDRDSEKIASLSDNKNISYRRMISMAIKTYKKNGVKVGFCGQQPSDSLEFCKFLINEKIDSISVTPDSALKTMQMLNNIS